MSSWSQQAQQNKFDTMTWKSCSPSQQQKQPQKGGFVLHQNGRDSSEAQRLFPVVHANLKTGPSNSNMPPDDMMAPQSISFIGDEDGIDEDEADNYQAPRKNFRQSYNQMDDLEVSLGKLNTNYQIQSSSNRCK
jgi:hypothetical protein